MIKSSNALAPLFMQLPVTAFSEIRFLAEFLIQLASFSLFSFATDMSTKLAKQSLDLLLKQKRSSNASSSESKNDRRSLKLPDTKKGIKKVKYEMRYGHLQKKKAEEAKLKRKENPISKCVFYLQKICEYYPFIYIKGV